MRESNSPNTDDTTLSQDLSPQTGSTREQWLAALHEDQRRRWQAGKPILVEDYLARLPHLAHDHNAVLALIVAEIRHREQHGDPPTAEHYIERFPAFSSQLCAWFQEQHLAVDTGGPGPEHVVDPYQTIDPRQLERPSSNGASADAENNPSTSASLYQTINPSAQVASSGSGSGSAPDADLFCPEVVEGSQLPKVPGYRILGTLGRGGMGVVYKAQHEGLNRIVALKMIRDAALAGADDLVRFQTEAQALASLQHPNIVQVFDVGKAEGLPYFSLEYVDGGSLSAKLAHEPQPPRWSAEVLETLARAMYAAHQKNIIHRDLKPANVLLTPEGTPKITDFGLAKKIDADSAETRSGSILGTPNYMAPEQAAGDSAAVGPLSDVYALGAMFYEMLTGRPPFQGTTPLETVMQVCQDEPVPPRRLQARVPVDLETICLKSMAKDRRQRYADAGALADDLRRWLDGVPILARPVSPLEKAVKWARRRPAAAAAAAFAVLAVVSIVGGAMLYLDQRARNAETEAERLRVAEERRREAEQKVAPISAALREGRYPEAAGLAEQALDRIRDQTDEDSLRQQLQQLCDDARAGAGYRDRWRNFERLANDANYWQTQSTGADPTTNAARAGKAAAEALALFDVTRDSHRVAPTIPSRYFSEAERQEVADGVRALWLVLVWAEGHPLPNLTAAENRRRAETALGLLQRIKDDGSVRSYYLLLAEALTALGRKDEAKQVLAQMPPQPVDVADWYTQGVSRYLDRDYEAAAGDFEEVVRRQPQHFWAQYRLALCQLHLGPQTVGDAATARFGAAVAYLDFCLGRRKDFVAALLLRGYARAELGLREQHAHPDKAAALWRAAEQDFQRAEEGLKQSPSADDEYSLLTNRALLWLHQEKYAAAVADLRRACQLKPKQVQAYALLAEAGRRQKDFGQALTELKTAIDLDPRQPSLLRTRARLHESAGDAAAALRDYAAAAALEPPASRAAANDHLERGTLLMRAKNYPEAIAAFDAALAVRPELARAQILRGAARYWLAEAAADPEKKRPLLEEAARDVDDCLRREKATADVYVSRGQIRTQLALCCMASKDPQEQVRALGLFSGAAEDFGRALDLRPDTGLRIKRGWLLLTSLDAPKIALPSFKEVAQQDEANTEARIGLALCRAEVGGWREAVVDLDKALEQARRQKQETPFLLYHASRVYARAVAGIDAEKADPQLTALRVRCQNESATLLRRAIESKPPAQRTPFWRDVVRKDKAFQAVQSSASYRRLAQDYDKNGS
jgi:tetratricopeptide (TPR) repeat protein/tRNA A-37 threonylcarbamoyl transferase component Bud32